MLVCSTHKTRSPLSPSFYGVSGWHLFYVSWAPHRLLEPTCPHQKAFHLLSNHSHQFHFGLNPSLPSFFPSGYCDTFDTSRAETATFIKDTHALSPFTILRLMYFTDFMTFFWDKFVTIFVTFHFVTNPKCLKWLKCIWWWAETLWPWMKLTSYFHPKVIPIIGKCTLEEIRIMCVSIKSTDFGENY